MVKRTHWLIDLLMCFWTMLWYKPFLSTLLYVLQNPFWIAVRIRCKLACSGLEKMHEFRVKFTNKASHETEKSAPYLNNIEVDFQGFMLSLVPEFNFVRYKPVPWKLLSLACPVCPPSSRFLWPIMALKGFLINKIAVELSSLMWLYSFLSSAETFPLATARLWFPVVKPWLLTATVIPES